jgi:very-short-patch-repair endonuclease
VTDDYFLPLQGGGQEGDGSTLIGQTNKEIQSKKLQRELRNSMTDAEKALWQVLRCRQMCGCKYRRQHPFGSYILDFVCLNHKLVVEVDGGQHCEHTERDHLRTVQLQSAGFVVLRFWNHDILQEIEAVKEKIWMILQGKQSHPHPGPPLEGEGANSQRRPLDGGEA